jgi:hypothetical protein
MKATLEFNLPEDTDDYDIHRQATKYFLFQEDVFNYFRHKLKYENLTDKEYEIYEKIKSDLYDLLRDE